MLITVRGRLVRSHGVNDLALPGSGVIQYQPAAHGTHEGALRGVDPVPARITDGEAEPVELTPGPWRVSVFPEYGDAWEPYLVELTEDMDEPVELADLAPVLVIDGEKWATGPRGVSVIGVRDNGDQTVTWLYSDGTESDPVRIAVGPEGEQGDRGDQGASVTGAVDHGDGTVSFTLSDGGVTEPVVMPPGPAGRGVESISDPDEDSLVTITYTDGSTSTVQAVRGRPGDPGSPGDPGEPGEDGRTPVIEWDGTALVIDGETGPDLQGPQGEGADVDWDSLPGKPSTFPPAAHTHPFTEVDGLDDSVISTSTEVVRWGTDLDAIPQRTTATDAVFAWADNEGRVAAEVDQSGAFLFQRDLSTPAQHPVAPAAGWRHVVTDEAGHVTHGVDTEGRFQVFRGVGARAALRTKVACIGDSLTRGGSGGSVWPIEQSWPALINAARPDIEVTNLGWSGRTTDEIRILAGALPLYLAPEGGAIPASGPVAVETEQVIGWSASNTITLLGTLAGVGGTFTRTSAGMTFTRAGTGPSVVVPGAARLHADVPDYSSHTVTLWVGRNDVNHSITGMYETTVEHVVSGVLETVEWLGPRSKSIVVISAQNQAAEPEGTAGYDTVAAINAQLRALLPHKFLDIRSYLVNQAIYDAGVTPTVEDLANMAADAPPFSIWDTGSHFLSNISPLVAARIQDRLTAKGYI